MRARDNSNPMRTLLCAGLAATLFAPMHETRTAEVISVNSGNDGIGITDHPYQASSLDTGFTDRQLPGHVSADGRYVVFSSGANNLVATDNNERDDVFLRDRTNRTTTLISVNRDGTDSGDRESGNALISSDGRYVVFHSKANNLVDSDGGGDITDVYVRDVVAGTTTLVSLNSAGTRSGNSFSFNPAISANGRVVAFDSIASDLSPLDSNGLQDVFVRDLNTGTTVLASVNRVGTASGNGFSRHGVLSADGRVVVFVSTASDLVANDTNGEQDVFARDLTTNTTRLVSVNRNGTASGNGPSRAAAISANGRFVVFLSRASDLVRTSDTREFEDVFVRDLVANTTTLVSVNLAGTASGNNESGEPPREPGISASGRFVVFTSLADDLVTNDGNGQRDVFVRDLAAGTTTLVSVAANGGGSGDGPSGDAVISDDGGTVAFTSFAGNLVSNTTLRVQNVYVRDLRSGVTTLLSTVHNGAGGANAPSGNPKISGNGRVVAFDSRASDLSVLRKSSRNIAVFAEQVP